MLTGVFWKKKFDENEIFSVDIEKFQNKYMIIFFINSFHLFTLNIFSFVFEGHKFFYVPNLIKMVIKLFNLELHTIKNYHKFTSQIFFLGGGCSFQSHKKK